MEENSLRWIGQVNRRREKNVAKVLRAMVVDGETKSGHQNIEGNAR